VEEPPSPEPKRKSRKKAEKPVEKKEENEPPKETAPSETTTSTEAVSTADKTEKEAHDKKIEVLEKGRIFFLYRPTVNTEHPHGLPEVQKTIVILHPKEVVEASKPKLMIKEFIIPRKTLPSLSSGHRDQRFMRLDYSSESVDDIVPILQKHGYHIASKDEERVQEEARALAEGDYVILKHFSGYRPHTHLMYVLGSKEQQIQHEFQVEKEGDFLISVKNPTIEDSFQHGDRPELPSKLQELWGTRKWIPLETVELLEYKGLNLLLATGKKRSDEAKEIEEEMEKLEEEIEEESLPPQKIFEELHLPKEDLAPLASGTWQ